MTLQTIPKVPVIRLSVLPQRGVYVHVPGIQRNEKISRARKIRGIQPNFRVYFVTGRVEYRADSAILIKLISHADTDFH